ncbi:MAG: DUF4412 domain-containing protein [Chitinophagaceae bacterium]
MKRIILFACLLAAMPAFAQSSDFKMPSEIKFERTAVQKITDKKTTMLTYYFTVNGDYAALKPEAKDNTMIIYTKEGNMLIVSEKEKTIVVMNMKGILNMAKEIAENHASKDSLKEKASSRKTGNTKSISGYTAEEYEVTTEKGKMNLWYAKVDFNSVLAMTMGMMKGPGGKSAYPGQDLGDLPTPDKGRYMVQVDKDGKTVLETLSIDKTDFKFSTAGYTVRDMSSMMKGNSQ